MVISIYCLLSFDRFHTFVRNTKRKFANQNRIHFIWIEFWQRKFFSFHCFCVDQFMTLHKKWIFCRSKSYSLFFLSLSLYLLIIRHGLKSIETSVFFFLLCKYFSVDHFRFCRLAYKKDFRRGFIVFFSIGFNTTIVLRWTALMNSNLCYKNECEWIDF